MSAPHTALYVTNPALVVARDKKNVRLPKVTGQEALTALHALKPGEPVGQEVYDLLMAGVNAGTAHPGHVEIKSGAWLPLLVEVVAPKALPPKPAGGLAAEEIPTPAPDPRAAGVLAVLRGGKKPPAQKAWLISSLAKFAAAVKGDYKFKFAKPKDGLTPCSVAVNAAEGVCICGGWHLATEMRAIRLGERATLAIGPACAKKLTGITFDPKSFAEVIGLKKPVASSAKPPQQVQEKPQLTLTTWLNVAEWLGKSLWLNFSAEIPERKGFFLCTFAHNGKGLCTVTAHSRNLFALGYKEHVFPVCPACKAELLKAMPKAVVTSHSFAQARGWGQDVVAVGKYDPDRASKKAPVEHAAPAQPKAKPARGSAAMTREEMEAAAARNAAERERHRLARKAQAAAPPPKAKEGKGKKAKGK